MVHSSAMAFTSGTHGQHPTAPYYFIPPGSIASISIGGHKPLGLQSIGGIDCIDLDGGIYPAIPCTTDLTMHT